MIRLTKERKARELSKAALAHLARLDQSLLSKIEAGRVTPYPKELSRIAEALGWPKAKTEMLLEEVG